MKGEKPNPAEFLAWIRAAKTSSREVVDMEKQTLRGWETAQSVKGPPHRLQDLRSIPRKQKSQVLQQEMRNRGLKANERHCL